MCIYVGFTSTPCIIHSLAALLVTIETMQDPNVREAWAGVQRRWGTPPEDIATNPRGYLLSVLADGLWVHDYINGRPLSDDERTLLMEHAWKILSP